MRSDVLEELFYDHYRPALLYPLSLCRNLANAEGIVSQAFETALMAPEGSNQSFRYWLLTGCRNLWLDQVRPPGSAGHSVFTIRSSRGPRRERISLVMVPQAAASSPAGIRSSPSAPMRVAVSPASTPGISVTSARS